MCGIIAFKSKNADELDKDLIDDLLIQSQIRGKHATGISWVMNKRVFTFKEPLPAEKFVERFAFHNINDSWEISLIGHTRYSTSDLRYNQPIADTELSIVHNGVITQELPERWEELYGYKTETTNDTELLFHCLKEGKDPFTKFPDSSMSVAYLDKTGKIRYFHNEQRPLWCYEDSHMQVLSSTKDILIRCGMEQNFWEVPRNVIHEF